MTRFSGCRGRLIKTYTGVATPPVTYEYYTSGAPNVGRLKSVAAAGVSTTTYGSYDALGNVLASSQNLASPPSGIGASLPFSYTYFLNNALKTIGYPSGRLVSYTLDGAGRPRKVLAGPRTYFDVDAVTASAQRYAADGRVIRAKLGNGLWETHDYRTPGTPTVYRLGATEGAGDLHEVEYSFSGTQHNGNVLGQVIRHSGQSWTQGYTYDAVNRLSTAVETGGFNRTYGYDRWGNRWVASSTGFTQVDGNELTLAGQFNTANNRIMPGTTNYDAAGNLKEYAPYTAAYDGENRMLSMSSASNGNMTLSYDGLGQRVKKEWVGSETVTTVYAFDAFGQVAAEYQGGGTPETGPRYLTQDWLGSTRVVTDGTGAVVARHDYLPFGRSIYAGQNGRAEAMKYGPVPLGSAGRPAMRRLFTGQERDVEVDSGLDYFGARYMSAAQGRFTTPDPLMASAKASDPQSWNRMPTP